MKPSERSARDVLVEQLWRDGKGATAIGRRVGLNPARVRTILLERGVVTPGVRRDEKNIWESAENSRRMAIYKRARDAAREALANMEGARN